MNTLATRSQELVEQGQQLVHRLAADIRRKIPFRVEMEDLVAYGQVGLVEAARDFDDQRGAAFITYAYYRVRGAIYDGVSNMSWTSRAFHRKLRYQRLAEDVLGDDARGQDQHATLADGARWLSKVAERLAVVYLASRPDEPGLRDSAIEDVSTPSPPAVVAAREVGERLQRLIEGLPPLAGRLIRFVYYDGLTLQQAAERLSVSRSWASRLHAQTLERLAGSLRRLGEEG